MSAIRFDWDSTNAASNLRKHGVAFEEARTVFEDDEALLIADPEHPDREDRFVLAKLSAALRVIVAVHCERHDGAVIRIISARKVDRGERDDYAARRAP